MNFSKCVGRLLVFVGLMLFAVDVPGSRAVADDPIRQMQADAVAKGRAPWGHWGIDPDNYTQHKTHSNRLIPVYTFGASLAEYQGDKSLYRDSDKIKKLYGQVPTGTLNPTAEYLDQTDLYQLQLAALNSGKKYIVLMIFDGLDWVNTRTAAIAVTGRVPYDSGRGTGLSFQDYRGAPTDFGYFVCSPHNNGTKADVDAQAIKTVGDLRGGYDAQLAGAAPWIAPKLPPYMLGQLAPPGHRIHAVTDSAASATSLTCGIKTYNDAINVDPEGKQCKAIARIAQDRGYRVGAVTSVPLSHATPACAYANNVWRDDYQDISRDMLGLPSVSHKSQPLLGLDVVIGTGWGINKDTDPGQGSNFVPGNRYLTDADHDAVDVRHGGKYRVVERSAGVDGAGALATAAADAVAKHQRLLGFFGTKYEHLPFMTADGQYNPAPGRYSTQPGAAKEAETYTPEDLKENPKLKDIVSASLTVLSADDNPFWLMIEAGDVDWANHANNIDDSIGAIRSGDEAFRTLADWMEKHHAWQDAIVIVTADHGHYFVLRDPQAFVVPKP